MEQTETIKVKKQTPEQNKQEAAVQAAFNRANNLIPALEKATGGKVTFTAKASPYFHDTAEIVTSLPNTADVWGGNLTLQVSPGSIAVPSGDDGAYLLHTMGAKNRFAVKRAASFVKRQADQAFSVKERKQATLDVANNLIQALDKATGGKIKFEASVSSGDPDYAQVKTTNLRDPGPWGGDLTLEVGPRSISVRAGDDGAYYLNTVGAKNGFALKRAAGFVKRQAKKQNVKL